MLWSGQESFQANLFLIAYFVKNSFITATQINSTDIIDSFYLTATGHCDVCKNTRPIGTIEPINRPYNRI